MAQTRNLHQNDYIEILQAVFLWGKNQSSNIVGINEKILQRATDEFGDTFDISNLENDSSYKIKELCYSYFIFAAREGYISLIEFAYKNHLEFFINAPDSHGWTSLCYVIVYQQSDVIQYLLKQGANVYHKWHNMDVLKHAIRQLHSIEKNRLQKPIAIFNIILDWIVTHPVNYLQVILANSLLYVLSYSNLDKQVLQSLIKHIKDFERADYFFTLSRNQSDHLLFFAEQCKDRLPVFLNAKNEKGETPFEIYFNKKPSENWVPNIQLYLALGTTINSIIFDNTRNIYLTFIKTFGRDNWFSPLFYQAAFYLFLQLHTKMNIVPVKMFDYLLDKDLLNPNFIYLHYDEINKTSWLYYASDNKNFVMLGKHCRFLYHLINPAMTSQNFFEDNDFNQAFLNLKHTVDFLILQDKQRRGLAIDLSNLVIQYCQIGTSDFDWRFLNFRGMTFFNSWLTSPSQIKSLVGVQIDLHTLKSNGFDIQENPQGFLNFSRFGEDIQVLKERLIKDYQTYFQQENGFSTVLNTLKLFLDDTQHIVRLNKNSNQPLFGDTSSFQTIMREGQMRLLELSKQPHFQWDSSLSQNLIAVFKTNYLSEKNPISTIMRLLTSSQPYLTSTQGFLGRRTNTASSSASSELMANEENIEAVHNSL